MTVINVLTFPRTRSRIAAAVTPQRCRMAAFWFAALCVYMFQGAVRSELADTSPIRLSGTEEGIFGMLPSLWLQAHVLSIAPSIVGWAVVVVHGSWFIVPWIAAAYVTARHPRRLGSFFGAWALLWAFGLAAFALIPTEPPWMANADVVRVIALHVGTINDPNPTAAMPSMHVALPLVASFWFFRERLVVPALIMGAYAMLIAFEVVLAGEHYILDAAGAALFAAGAVGAIGLIERAWPYILRFKPGFAPSRQVPDGQRGQNLIEFAMLAPFVIALLACIVLLGIALNTRSSIQQAVREGARQVAVGKSEAAAKDLAAGNAPEVLTAAKIGICYPVDGTSQGKVGDPVRVFIQRSDGTEGYDFTIVKTGGVLKAIGIGNFTVTMKPRATSRLEKSVAAPANC